MAYTKFHDPWNSGSCCGTPDPGPDTPLTKAACDHWEQGIFDAAATADAAVPEADFRKVLARNPLLIVNGAITRDGNGAATSFAVQWPDGTAGTYTGTPSATFPGSVDSWTVTYGATTYTQPTLTRDGNGLVTDQPLIQVT